MPKLWLVATPIGHLGDLSPRGREVLSQADFWIVEDTRVSGKLQAVVGQTLPMKVLNDHSRPAQIDQLVAMITEVENVALLTDAGCPVISDPGANLVDACIDRNVEIDAVPGPSAVTTALMLSGFYGQQFAFLGFLGRKPGAIKKAIKPFRESTFSLVLFESPHRFRQLLDLAYEVLGSRRYVICRELTKAHQQVYRGTLGEMIPESAVPAKGEFTLVIEGHRRSPKSSEDVYSQREGR